MILKISKHKIVERYPLISQKLARISLGFKDFFKTREDAFSFEKFHDVRGVKVERWRCFEKRVRASTSESGK